MAKSNWNLEVSVFVEGGKPENRDSNPRSRERIKNKVNPHETLSTGIEPGSQKWEAKAPVFPKYDLRCNCLQYLQVVSAVLSQKQSKTCILNLFFR